MIPGMLIASILILCQLQNNSLFPERKALMMKHVLCLGLILCLLMGLTACKGDDELSSQVSSSGSIFADVPNDDSLFPDGPDGIYNYCPVIKQTDENTRYVYYCANMEANIIIDYIIGRKGIRQADGSWKWSEKKVVLEPTPDTFDSRHTCDPSVVAGEFRYQGEIYSYLMTYTGAVNTDNQDNDTGIAVAKDPLGPWIKVDSLNPFLDWKRDTSEEVKNKFQWGYGQPSMVSVDKKGKVLVFYSVGTHTATNVAVDRWDLSDLDNPVREATNTVTNRGLTDLNGGADFLNNADFGYDETENRFYAISDCHPNPTDQSPDFIAGKFRLTYISDTPKTAENHQVGDVFFSPAGKSWSTMAVVGEEQTGFPRNHNTGLVTDAFGWMLGGNQVETMFAMSRTGSNYLWTYRIYGYTFHKTE